MSLLSVRNYSSPLIARSPRTGELVTAEVDTRGTRECTVHISTDDGRSWKPGGNPMVEPFTDCSIGAEYGSYFNLFFDRDGVLYLPFAANDPALKTAPRPVETEDERDYIPRNVFLARSTDGGRTFTTSPSTRWPRATLISTTRGWSAPSIQRSFLCVRGLAPGRILQHHAEAQEPRRHLE